MLRDDQLNVLWISRIDYEKKTGVAMHTHNDIFQLLFVIDGNGKIILNNQEYELLPQNVYLMFPDDEHSFYFQEPSSTIDIKFSITDSKLYNFITNSKVPFPYFLNDYSKIKELFKTSLFKEHNDCNLTSFRVDMLFKDFLVSLIQKNHSQQQTSEVTNQISIEFHTDFPIQNYILQNLHESISLDDISKEFGYHPHYIIDLFKKKFNVTPMKYLQHLRIEKAKEFLELSSLPISEIAERIGLSIPYFSRLFNSIEGTSPSDYRNQTRTVVGKDIVLDDSFYLSLSQQPDIIDEK
ncbi:AraC family transcriptional regulator [Oceanobacillus sp. M60]|uniref:AraC family transcriptional regulator n=1 Tax=Oceanobacillus oncorhynchi TaxID=545501 RepID=UPI0018676D8F|nr:AraC family transcriptional regulator [Oceanobacillus oncorhynchi]